MILTSSSTANRYFQIITWLVFACGQQIEHLRWLFHFMQTNHKHWRRLPLNFNHEWRLKLVEQQKRINERLHYLWLLNYATRLVILYFFRIKLQFICSQFEWHLKIAQGFCDVNSFSFDLIAYHLFYSAWHKKVISQMINSIICS